MRFGICTLDEFTLKGKTVLCRVDMNQPVDHATGTLKSTARIEACAPTLAKLADAGAKVVVLAHQGSDIEYKNFYTTRPHAAVLENLLGRPILFVEDVCGPTAQEAIKGLKEGEILLLDNVRFCSEEQTLFEMKLRLSHEEQAKTQVVTKLAPLADMYVCDAFAAAHRDQPTLCGFEQVLPSAMGPLFEKEYCVISELMESPARPCTFVLGGTKISDAFLMLETVLGSGAADCVLTGGMVGHIMLQAMGKDISKGTLDYIYKSNYEEYIDKAKVILEKYGDKIKVPTDFAWLENDERKEGKIGALPADICALDIGAETAKAYADIIMASKTAFVNGPMGVFEMDPTELGTKVVFNALADSEAYTVVGGGDSVTAAKKYKVADRISYICTGGGALIRFLTGEELPVVKALRHAAKTFGAK